MIAIFQYIGVLSAYDIIQSENYSMLSNTIDSGSIGVSVNYDIYISVSAIEKPVPLKTEPYEISVCYANLFVNSDTDRMPDWWELFYGTNMSAFDENDDPDNDGVLNITEYIIGTDPNNPDTDGDGMPDYWEFFYGTNPLINDKYLDYDGDNLLNLAEFIFGTDPLNPDTDGDGMSDSLEILSGRNPLVADITYNLDTVQSANYSISFQSFNLSSVGISMNYDLIYTMETLKMSCQTSLNYSLIKWFENLFVNSDTDRMPDWWESYYSTNMFIFDENTDPDNDGLLNITEYIIGTDPNNPDTDGDGMPDDWEFFYGTNPLINDRFLDYDGDNLLNLAEFISGTDPLNPDTDGDGMSDSLEILSGRNPLVADITYDLHRASLLYSIHIETINFAGTVEAMSASYDLIDSANIWHAMADTSQSLHYSLQSGILHILVTDTDGDGMPDYWETLYGSNPCEDDSWFDPDNDGLPNIEEYKFGTNPFLADTDGDGQNDLFEIIAGTDPLDTNSKFYFDIVMNNGQVCLMWTARSGRTYTIMTKHFFDEDFIVYMDDIHGDNPDLPGLHMFTDTGLNENGDLTGTGDIPDPASNDVNQRMYKIIIKQ
jgi:hypothetical protein